MSESNAPSGASTSNNTSKPQPPASGSESAPKSVPRLDRASASTAPKTGVAQPKPQALAKRTGPSSIIVSPRQKGNPVLTSIKSLPWEYGDIPADYVLGVTTCALFLSLKYHKLHPEYIYTRIKGLQGKYLLRVVLCMVDIGNHEESLRELSKTSLINNITIILCWSAAEGARYLELFKQYENAPPTAIKQHQSNAYADRMVDFITTPRSINKTDAVSLVSQFGTIRTAVNARHEDVAGIAGWGEKKVQRWCASVREPFRIQRAARKGIVVGSQPASLSRDVTTEDGDSPAPGLNVGQSPLRRSESRPDTADADRRPGTRLAEEIPLDDTSLFVEEEAALAEAMSATPAVAPAPAYRPAGEAPKKRKPEEDPLSDGVMAALSKLRKS